MKKDSITAAILIMLVMVMVTIGCDSPVSVMQTTAIEKSGSFHPDDVQYGVDTVITQGKCYVYCRTTMVEYIAPDLFVRMKSSDATYKIKFVDYNAVYPEMGMLRVDVTHKDGSSRTYLAYDVSYRTMAFSIKTYPPVCIPIESVATLKISF